MIHDTRNFRDMLHVILLTGPFWFPVCNIEKLGVAMWMRLGTSYDAFNALLQCMCV